MSMATRGWSCLLVGAFGLWLAGCASPKVQECGATGVFCPAGTHCAAAEGVCLPDTNTCGDAHLDPGEKCDDGNTKDGDGCSHDCQSDESCGNGVIDANARVPEICDDGNTKDGDGCSHDCLSKETCGNGYQDFDEECDDGNTIAGDHCSPDCKIERCGNGIIDPGEACDLDPPDLTRCSADCKSNLMCGNGTVDSGEECDLGAGKNNDNGDCRTDCIINRCGDGFKNTLGAGPGHLEHVEACDDAPKAAVSSRDLASPESAGCDADCSAPSCGDSLVNRHFTASGADGPEQCDPPNVGHGCSAKCRFESCGNGIVDPGEECDGTAGLQPCSADCFQQICGNGILDPSEECDLGTANADTGACTKGCKLAKCGDGKTWTGHEECDGSANCAADCHLKSCGNSIIDPGEECDDGSNNADNKDCTAGCKVNRCGDGKKDSAGSHLEACESSGADSAACNRDCTAPSCGDGKVNPQFIPTGGTAGEQCDPPSAGNGCSALCRFENCGNGVVDPGEACDDGNTVDGDACDNNCTVPACGNGVKDPGEDCDDGNNVNNDGCDNNCTASTKCNNGVIDTGEICDDNNSTCGACSTDCKTVQSAPATGLIFAADETAFAASGGTFTINDGTTQKTFEIVKDPAAVTANVKVVVATGDSAAMVATTIATAITGTTLTVTATAVNGAVVLQHKRSTTLGNKTIATNMTAVVGFMVSGMAGAKGGDCATAQACTQAIDCQSNSCVNGKCT